MVLAAWTRPSPSREPARPRRTNPSDEFEETRGTRPSPETKPHTQAWARKTHAASSAKPPVSRAPHRPLVHDAIRISRNTPTVATRCDPYLAQHTDRCYTMRSVSRATHRPLLHDAIRISRNTPTAATRCDPYLAQHTDRCYTMRSVSRATHRPLLHDAIRISRDTPPIPPRCNGPRAEAPCPRRTTLARPDPHLDRTREPRRPPDLGVDLHT
jgi:hypothetical protein